MSLSTDLKLVIDANPEITLTGCFVLWAILSVIPWLRTFFLMPRYAVPHDVEDYSLFQDSFAGRCCYAPSEEEQEENEKYDVQDLADEEEKVSAPSEFWRSLKTPLFWQYTAVFTIMSFRIKSIQGWVYPWMTWTYLEADDYDEDFVDSMLNYYGITMFFSPFISLIPGFIIKGVKACTGSQPKGDFWSLIIIFVVCCAGCTIVSLQMCYQATSQGDSANTWFFLNTFCAWRTLVYANPAQFLLVFYPPAHFSSLYATMNFPSLIALWFIDPLYKLITSGGDSLSDAEFCPVQLAFAIACAACALVTISLFIKGKGRVAKLEALEAEMEGFDNPGLDIKGEAFGEPVEMLYERKAPKTAPRETVEVDSNASKFPTDEMNADDDLG